MTARAPRMADTEMHVMTVDVGTSSTRVSAISLGGSLVARAESLTVGATADIHGELDADAEWSRICRLVGEVISASGQPRAVAVAAQLGMVAVDANLTPVLPAFLWHDRRAVEETGELERLLERGRQEISGRVLAPELFAPRLRWIAKHAPDSWALGRWVLSLKDFIVARLTGEIVTDPTSASYTGLFDVAGERWAPPLLAAAELVPEWLPVVRPADSQAGTVNAAAARATGLRAGTPVAVGGPDGSVGALGSGAATANQTVDIAGTTDVLLHTVDHPIHDPQRRSVLNSYLLPELWTVGGPTGMTGGAVGWLSAILGYPSVEAAYEELGDTASDLPAGAGGVRFQTALTGERFPTWASAAAGQISGVRPDHGPAHLLRAAEEGAALTVRDGLEALADLGVYAGDVRVSGGISKRRAVMQLRANVWRRPVVPVTASDSTTRGAAMLAAVCGGLHDSVGAAATAMVSVGSPIDPQDGVADAYDAVYSDWKQLRGGAGVDCPQVQA
jgi:xylulokinase